MTSYPNGVVRNNSTPNMPVEILPVATSNWPKFCTQADADVALGMISGVTENTTMEVASGAEYDQYIYLVGPRATDIRCQRVQATARDEDGGMRIDEFAGIIFDADTVPRPFIDTYTAGQPHTLKVQRIERDLGYLYWDVAK